jgi:hypothetical protein
MPKRAKRRAGGWLLRVPLVLVMGWAQPAVARSLGLALNPPAGFDFQDQLVAAADAGVSRAVLDFPWVTLEPDAGQRDLTPLTWQLRYFADRNVRVLLSIPAVDTFAKRVPRDLMELPLDHPRVLSRYRELLSDLLQASGDELEFLVVGNEAEVYLSFDPDGIGQWHAYRRFVAGAVQAVHAKRPELPVGVNVSFAGIGLPEVAEIVAEADALFTSYYFVEDEKVSPPTQLVPDDFDAMLALAGDKPLVVKECGYPTGSSLGGSLDAQVEFVSAVFSAWDRDASRIPLVVFHRMFDRTPTDCRIEAILSPLGSASPSRPSGAESTPPRSPSPTRSRCS